MNSKEIYKKKFEELLAIEEKARDLYKYYINRIEDPVLLETFQRIYNDEEWHVKAIRGFINKISE